MAGTYRARVVDAELRERLGTAGAVVVEGPKACGKTATGRQHTASEVLLDVDERARQAADIDPSLLLDGATPRLFDEWQLAPTLWNHLRRAIDDRGQPGQFVLTGSARPADEITRHSGAGRISRVRMRPMSLYETGDSNGAVSLGALLDGDVGVRAPDAGLTFDGLVDRLCVGGWPGLLGATVSTSQRWNRDYLDEIRRTDIRQVDGVSRDPDRVGRVLRSLARNLATEVSATTLAADTGGREGPVTDDTVRDYLAALDRLMVVEDQPAWSPHLRSKAQLRTSPKRHFADPALAVAALRASPQALRRDLRSLGFLFESLVVRDLRVHAQAHGGVVHHYRDNKGTEVDAIVDTGDGRWAAFEVKLGGTESIEAAAAALVRFRGRIDTERMGSPAALGVIVATGYGYMRDDGVAVLPIGALAP